MGLEEGAKPIPDAPQGMSGVAMVPVSSGGLMGKETGRGKHNEEMVIHLKTDDSKNKSTLQHVAKKLPAKGTMGLEEVAKAIPVAPQGTSGGLTGKGRGRGRPRNVPDKPKPPPPVYGGAGHLITGEIARAYKRDVLDGSGSSGSSCDVSFKTVVDRFERIGLHK